MNSLRNFLIVVVLFLAIVGWFGYSAWKSMHKIPGAKLEQQQAQLRQQIDGGTKTLASMRQTINGHTAYFARSFPLNRVAGQAEYQIWLTQLGEFCDMDDLAVTAGAYRQGRGVGTQQFQVHARCSMEDLYRFLYEFSWTPLLHRINSLDIGPMEKSNLLDITLIIESMTLARPNPQAIYPLTDRLPLGGTYLRRLASGPFKAYDDIAKMDLFRYSSPGLDAAQYVILTGTPSITNSEDGTTLVASRWKFETEGRTVQLGIGQQLSVGSFQGVIDDIKGDLVVIRQDSGYRWVVLLGEKLSEASAVPPELF
ncbi:MAG: hypothetical protein PHQ75_09430 [Thermoguttaceae bacterium]|nr:hypothetical protein [Thermoguttaceae bacterium]